MTPADFDASTAAALSWLLTYAIHSTILLGAAVAIAARFADEHAWLDLVWKTALLGPLVTASVQAGSSVIPLGGRWPIATDAQMAGPPVAAVAPAMPLTPRTETPVTLEKTGALPSSHASNRGGETVQPALSDSPDVGVEGPALSDSPDVGVEGPALSDSPDVGVEGPASPATISAGAWHRVARLWPAMAVLSWLAIAAAGLVRFAARLVRVHRVLGSGPPVSAPHLRQTVEALRDAARDRSPIHVTTSKTCAVPLALAGRHIVLPERFLQQLDAEQQQAALAHEIAHVIRRDPAWRILAGALERAFFFQPLNRIARAKLCDSAEFLCDQWAVQHTRSPLALARCLSVVASWASPASDGMAVGVSTMARSDSAVVRRVTRILNDPLRPSRRPSLVWLTVPLALVAIAAPRVTAAQPPDPADAASLSATVESTIPLDAGEQKHEPTSRRVWTATELAQARARLRVHRPPRPTDSLAERWRWALADAGRQGIGDFWIVYTFETPTHARELMMSDTREGSWVSATGQLITEGPPLADVLGGTTPIPGAGNVAVLLHYRSARADAIDRGGFRSMPLGFEFGRTPVYWLGFAPESDSFGRVRELFEQVRNEKIQVLLIELASLHPSTDVVLPFLTRLVEPSNPVAIRREAAEGFDHHHDPRSVEILLRVARTDPASEVRTEAAETIGEVQTPQSIPALTDLVTNSPDPSVRREAAEAFGDQPADLALPAIDRVLAASAQDEVLVEAIEALGDFQDARALDMLVRTAAVHPSRSAQQEAVETLGDIEDPEAIAALVRIVWEHDDATIQREAVETLGDRDEAAAVTALEGILAKHPVEDVQAEAIETLADVSGDGLNPQIYELALSGNSPRLRREALEAIAEAASHTSDAQALDQAQRTIERAIFDDPDRAVQMEALDALDELPRDRALQILRTVVERHPDSRVRKEAEEHQRDRRQE